MGKTVTSEFGMYAATSSATRMMANGRPASRPRAPLPRSRTSWCRWRSARSIPLRHCCRPRSAARSVSSGVLASPACAAPIFWCHGLRMWDFCALCRRPLAVCRGVFARAGDNSATPAAALGARSRVGLAACRARCGRRARGIVPAASCRDRRDRAARRIDAAERITLGLLAAHMADRFGGMPAETQRGSTMRFATRLRLVTRWARRPISASTGARMNLPPLRTTYLRMSMR